MLTFGLSNSHASIDWAPPFARVLERTRADT